MDIYILIEKQLKAFLGNYKFVIDEMGGSPRSIGDKVQEVITKSFPEVCQEVAKQLKLKMIFQTKFTRRSFEDVAFTIEDTYFAFDVKTKSVEAEFHMPNIKSVERLINFYTSDKNTFIIVSADYKLNLGNQQKPITFIEVTIAPIEQVNWECLRFGGLGYGQLQVEPNKPIIVNREQTRKEWMDEFFKGLISFYTNELRKSKAMVNWAQKCHELWQKGKFVGKFNYSSDFFNLFSITDFSSTTSIGQSFQS